MGRSTGMIGADREARNKIAKAQHPRIGAGAHLVLRATVKLPADRSSDEESQHASHP